MDIRLTSINSLGEPLTSKDSPAPALSQDKTEILESLPLDHWKCPVSEKVQFLIHQEQYANLLQAEGSEWFIITYKSLAHRNLSPLKGTLT